MLKVQMNSDKLAVGLSTACVIHCFFAPSLIVFSYSFLSFSVDSELVHYLILLFALPISILALGLGYKNDKETSYFIIGITGLMVLQRKRMLLDQKQQLEHLLHLQVLQFYLLEQRM